MSDETRLATRDAGTAKLFEVFERVKPQFADVLPSHLSADRVVRLAMAVVKQSRELAGCTQASVLTAVMHAASMGLEPGVFGECHFIPYKTDCTLVVGWQGLLKLANNTGNVSVHTGAVYEGDLFEYQLGARPDVQHRVRDDNFDPPDAPKPRLTHVYAVAHQLDRPSAPPKIEVWTAAKVRRHWQQFNRVAHRHYAARSDHHFEMYARKVVLLQLLKYLPRSVELNRAIEAEHALTNGPASPPRQITGGDADYDNYGPNDPDVVDADPAE